MKPQQLELVAEEPRVARDAGEVHALAVKRYRREVMPAIASACRIVGKDLGDLFDARASHVGDAVAFREINGSVRAFDVEWLVALLMFSSEGVKLEILTELCSLAGYMSPERKRTLTVEDEYRIYRENVRKAAPAVDALASKAIGES